MKYELVKFVNNNLELEINVSPEEETVWLSKENMSILFNRDRSVISRYIKNIFECDELKEKSNVHFLHIANSDKPFPFYSLDVVISVGYKVKSPNGVVFRKWANTVLKKYLIKGYVINDKRTLVTNENYVNLINRVNNIDNKLSLIESENLYFSKTIVVYEGNTFDGLTIISDLVSKAKHNLVLIDPYADTKTLNVLKNKDINASLLLITSDRAKLSQMDIDSFNDNYSGLSVVINNSYHDRYLIIDDFIFYHLGSSINYLGNKFAQIDKIVDEDLKDLLRKRINEQK